MKNSISVLASQICNDNIALHFLAFLTRLYTSVGLAGNVHELLRFRTQINTLLASDRFVISRPPPPLPRPCPNRTPRVLPHLFRAEMPP